MISQEAMAIEIERLDAPDPSFYDAVVQSVQILDRWLADPSRSEDLDALPDGVFVRNLDGALVLSNAAYRALFEPGQASPGRSSRVYLPDDLRRISEGSDALLLAGVKSIEMRHEFEGTPGDRYDLLVYKRLLRGPDHPPYLLGVLRLLARHEPSPDGRRLDLKASARVVGTFDDVDLRICRGICGGATNQSLSVDLGMTTRAVEMRRQKILSQLGLNHTVELVKLLVRLQDRGHLDLGI